MRQIKMLFCFLLCVLMLCGCQKLEIRKNVPDLPEKEEISTTQETTGAAEVSKTELEEFPAYEFTVQSSNLTVHSGPGYQYEATGFITDCGVYTIIAEEIEKLGGGKATVWGKLSTGGWINLQDALAEENPDVPEKETEALLTETTAAFQPYIFKVVNPWLQIYAGPGYDYQGCGDIREQGSYTIIEESVQTFAGGRSVTWGRLKSGAGWICLDDAKLNPEGGPPYRCTECGRADVYISRYALCSDCHEAQNAEEYGTCAVCGGALDYEEYISNDGFVCFDCLVCGWCGDPITIMDVTAFSAYMCRSCYEAEYCCYLCGADCFRAGTIDGLCEECYDAQNVTYYCTHCGTELNEWNTAFEGFGKCIDCYYATLDPEYICDNCGADCSFRGSIDGLCEDCYEAANQHCNYCGGPLNGNHDCDDYPNVHCPNCDWSMFTTGVGIDGIICPDCGTRVV